MGNQTNSLPKLSHSTFWLFSHFVVVQSPSQIQLFATHGLQHAMLPCPILSPRVFSDSCPLSWWCHPTILSSVVPFSSCLQSFPASGSFQMSQFFTSGGQSIGVSTSSSILPVNVQGWFALGLTGLISLHSKGRSRVFSNGHSRWLNCSVVSDSLQPHGLQPARLLCPWGFSRQEYWSGLPWPPPRDPPNPGVDLRSPTLQADSLPSEPLGKSNLIICNGIILGLLAVKGEYSAVDVEWGGCWVLETATLWEAEELNVSVCVRHSVVSNSLWPHGL